jgi:hypothetical protein
MEETPQLARLYTSYSYKLKQVDLRFPMAVLSDLPPEILTIIFQDLPPSTFTSACLVSKQGDFHWVIFEDLVGAYQYFVNHALPTLGELRTLWRLDNTSFPNGRTNIKDGALPTLAGIASGTKVQDERGSRPTGPTLPSTTGRRGSATRTTTGSIAMSLARGTSIREKTTTTGCIERTFEFCVTLSLWMGTIPYFFALSR